jgi:hypothetical protein
MEQAALTLGSGPPLLESVKARAASVPLRLDVFDPEVVAELRRRTAGEEREQFALAALRIGVLAMKSAAGQVDAGAVREAGVALMSEVRELLSQRATELNERMTSTLTQYLDPQSGALPQRLHALVRQDGELERLFRAQIGADDSLLSRSLGGQLAAHLGDASPLFKLLSPTDKAGLKAQLTTTIEAALTEQRTLILREFSLDQKGSALSRLVSEFSLDDDGSAMNRLSKMLTATSEQIGKNLTLDDEGSALSRLKRELEGMVGRLMRENGEFQSQMREAMARLDTRRKEGARSPRHGIEFEEQLGALLSEEAQRTGDLYEATGDTTGVIKNCKVGDYVIELGPDSAAAHARVVWEAKEKQGSSFRAAIDEIDEARRNRHAQVGVFVFSSKTAPEGLEPLARHGNDIMVVWNPDDPASDVVLRAAYSLARCLAVRERRADKESQAVLHEIDRAVRGVEKQVGYLEEVRRWAETVKGHGEKIAERSTRMVEDLKREVERLDTQLATMRTAETPV